MFFSCAIHIDDALDDFVNDCACPPDILLCSELKAAEEEQGPVCRYCKRPAYYVLKKPENNSEPAKG